MISQEIIEKIEDIIELHPYTFDEDEVNKAIFEDLIDNEEAENLCQGKIDIDYISDVMNEEDIKGYILIANNVYVGMMFYKIYDDMIELKVIGTNKNEETKGLPLGKYLLYILENEAFEYGINVLFAESLPCAFEWYIKNGWTTYSKDFETNKEVDTIPIEKVLIKYYPDKLDLNFEKEYNIYIKPRQIVYSIPVYEVFKKIFKLFLPF
jgi:hypothetical protein